MTADYRTFVAGKEPNIHPCCTEIKAEGLSYRIEFKHIIVNGVCTVCGENEKERTLLGMEE